MHHSPVWVILPRTKGLDCIALACVVLGLALTIWARIVLGKNWSSTVTFKENHERIVRGPYSLVRHPIYTGLLTMFFGTALSEGTLSGFIALPLVFSEFLDQVPAGENSDC